MIVERLCARCNFQLQLASDVPTGWQQLIESKSNPPDLILLDFNLPGENGLVLYDRLQQVDEFSNIPVALFSQRQSTPTIAEALWRGMKFLVCKELLADPEQWKLRIEQILEQSSPGTAWLKAINGHVPTAEESCRALHHLKVQLPLRAFGAEVYHLLLQSALTDSWPESKEVEGTSLSLDDFLEQYPKSVPAFLGNLCRRLDWFLGHQESAILCGTLKKCVTGQS